MKGFEDNLKQLFAEGRELEKKIQNNLKGLRYE
jgi:type I restriction enzyme M protein